MVTAGCCCSYLANATEKNGSSNVDPDPVRVGGRAAGADAGCGHRRGARWSCCRLQAATARRMIAAAAARMAGWQSGWWPDMGCSLC